MPDGHGLNNSAISGKCPGCAAYREKVARLKAANAALAAALRDARRFVRPFQHAHTSMSNQRQARDLIGQIHTALSDTAGEGWLPPEVREQVREGLHEIWSISAYPSPFYKRVKEIVGRIIRALDALED